MKKVYFAAIAFAGLTLASCGNTETEKETVETPVVEEVTYTVDTEASTLEWRGAKMVDGVEDHAHKGTVAVSEGMIMKKGDEFMKGKFMIDLTSVAITDLNVGDDAPIDTASVSKLINHLSTPDFLNLAEHKTAKVMVNSMTADNMNITLSVLGHEKTMDVAVTSSMDGDKMMTEGKFTMDMAGILPIVASEGPEYISSEVEFDLNLVLNK